MKSPMLNPSFTAIILFLSVISASSCRENISPESERRNIEHVIRSSISWAADKNLDLLYSVIADDQDYLEVHPDGKVVKGIAEFKKSEEFWMDPGFKAIRYDISDLKINISRSGSVAWWFCILNDINEWKGQPASWENTRWTGVVEKQKGKWVIVQMHFSFPSEQNQ
jgi:ketosteroid isomerase-like protein